MYINDAGEYVVDGECYTSVNAAYVAFRRLYGKSLGKAGKRRIENLRQRKWAISKRGIDFNDEYVQKLKEEFGGTKKVRCYIIGLFDISYGYVLSESEFDNVVCDLDDAGYNRYLDWLFCSKYNNLIVCGKTDKMVKRTYGGITVGYYVENKRKRNKRRKNGRRKKTRQSGADI